MKERALMHASQSPAQLAFPLHPAQYDVFREQLIETQNPFYNVGGYIRLKGRLDNEKIREAFRSAPAVFDVFRMRFHLAETDAVCSFEAGYKEMAIAELDLSHYPAPSQEAQCWVKRRFNLAFVAGEDELLFENVLLKIAADEHWLFMRYHHLIIDGYGFIVWAQYLAKRYALLAAGEDTQPVHPLYVNEISKAIAHKESDAYRLDDLYWKERISEKPRKFLESRYHHKQSGKSSTFNCVLPNSQRILFDKLQSQTGASVLHLTIAALLIYFGKATGASDFVFGIPLHKRDSRQMRNIVGMFAGMLPFKGRYKPDVKLIDFIKEIMLSQRRDYRYKNYFFGDLSRHLHLNPATESLYEIVVNYEPLHFDLDFGKEIHATVEKLLSESERLPLQLCWLDFGSQQPLQLQIIFREDYFTQKEIELLTRRILFILEQFSATLEAEIGSLSLIPAEEQQQLLDFNATRVDHSPDQTVIGLFEGQAARTPQKLALRFEEKQLSYRQLNENANQLAHYLKQKGVNESSLVPVCIERSPAMIAAVLAILKCGAAYVPVDPAYPVERIHYMLKDAAAAVVVTSALSQARLPALEKVEYVNVDHDQPVISKQPVGNLQISFSSAALVYIIYTSGSTGRPKGVQMPGANLVNLLRWQQAQFHPALTRQVLQFASLNFDVSFQEIFSTLCFGSSLYLIREAERIDMAALSGALRRYGITHLFLPYVVLKSLAEYLTTHAPHPLPLKTILVAGEQLKLAADIKQLLADGGITLINQYGPTEAHVVSSYTVDPAHSPFLPPIGKPISNTAIYVVDSALQLLPLGMPGEICLAGAGVARGYLHNEELSAEKFVANPFGQGRMYRTGDTGRWLPDGNLEYLGRIDEQVKIRGHRVEIGEVEGVLQQCPFVSQCAVIAKENAEGARQLVGYVVPKQRFDRTAMAAFLQTRLPEYMVPAVFISLETLPITANGKVDKNALPDPDAAISDGYVAPRTKMESAVVKIWQEVLGVEQVGIQDNFFALGGHSLLVVKTIAKIKAKTGIDVSPGSLFQYPTVEKYATFLSENHPEASIKHIIPIKSGNGKMPLYLICHIGLAPLSRFIPFAELLDNEQPVYGFHLPEVGAFDTESISIEHIASRYIDELLAHDPQGPYAFAGYSVGGLIAFEMAKQLQAKGREVALLGLFDTIAYTAEMLEPGVANASWKAPFRFVGALKKNVRKLYYKIDNNVYLLKVDFRNMIRGKKNNFLHWVQKHLKINIPLPPKSESQLLWEGIKVLSLAAYKKYKLTPYKGKITLFRARKRAVYFPEARFLGWKPFADSVSVYDADGNHYTMFNPVHARRLAKLLQHWLDKHAVDQSS